MKKIFCIIVIMMLLLVTLGCDSYTEIQIIPSNMAQTVCIELPQYDLSENAPYEIFYTENGCDVVIHFSKAEVQK